MEDVLGDGSKGLGLSFGEGWEGKGEEGVVDGVAEGVAEGGGPVSDPGVVD